MKTSLFAFGAAALLLAAASATPAAAAIRCDGPYQIDKHGGSFRSPYCEDEHIAYVASQHGRHVSADAVRHNPSIKAEVCHTIGHLPSVKLACLGYGPEDSGTFRH